MSDVIIGVERLGKRYRLGAGRSNQRYTALRDVVAEAAAGPFRSLSRKLKSKNGNPNLSSTPTFNVNSAPRNSSTEEFWALKDVSFEVKQGEVLGIIGRNGAGKSTLLKILSRITDPTEGRVRIRGRVASLLEVGTGFHPELTGRENIYLNGAILGMTKAEITKKFDEIVAFAETENFLDTPVKRYSSGMYVRLAFAVAAHLEPEILVVDEVLAVGDAEFQKKCLGKMQNVATREGRTVLFVSHNMATIEHLCQRVILLRDGRIAADDLPQQSIANYLSAAIVSQQVSLEQWRDRITNGDATITYLEIDSNEDNRGIRVGGGLKIRFQVNVKHKLVNPSFGVILHSASGEPLLDLRSVHAGVETGRMVGMVNVELTLEEIGLYPGRYLVSPWIADATCRVDIDFPRLCCAFEVEPAPGNHGDLRLDSAWGRYFVPSRWKIDSYGYGG